MFLRGLIRELTGKRYCKHCWDWTDCWKKAPHSGAQK